MHLEYIHVALSNETKAYPRIVVQYTKPKIKLPTFLIEGPALMIIYLFILFGNIAGIITITYELKASIYERDNNTTITN